MTNPAPAAKAVVVALNRRGEGVASDGRALPLALPGDVVGEPPAAPRATPFCRYFGTCGGCVAQHMPAPVYSQWKRETVSAALAREGLAIDVGPLVDAHGQGRRRATLHAREGEAGMRVGFMRARAHEIVEIEDCPLFAPELAGAVEAARALAEALKGLGKPFDIQATATRDGLDVDLRGPGPLDPAQVRKLLAVTQARDIARLSNHGVALIERRPPRIAFGPALARIPAGSFLQATAEGERALADRALAALAGAATVADLFCGAGAFALRLAPAHSVFAADSDAHAIAALRRAAAEAPLARPVEAIQRDLFRAPLKAAELARIDAVLFDPPRAGALAQTREIAASPVGLVVAISCNADSFARDARALLEAGFACESATPLDQFRGSPHVEIFATFRRRKSRRRRGALS